MPAKPGKTKALRLHELRVNNFMRIETHTISAKGRHVIVSAKNGVGKTSLLDALFVSIAGVDSKQMPEPITHGKNKAEIVVDLGEYIVKRTFTPKSSKVIVTDKGGMNVDSPTAFLQSLLHKISMNPATFLNERPQDQLDQVLEVAEVKCPVDEVKRITGEELLPNESESAYHYLERLSADEIGLFYTRRREVHRELEKTEAAVVKQKEKLDELPMLPPGQDFGELVQEQQRLEKAQGAYDQAKRDFTDRNSEDRQITQTFETQKGKVDLCEAELKDLEKKLLEKRQEKERLENKLKLLAPEVDAAHKATAEAEQALGQLNDMTVALNEVKAKVSAAPKQQEDRTKRKLMEDNVSALELEVTRWKKKWEALGQTLEQLRQLRKEVLEGVDLGVPGLKVGEGKLMFNGVDFKQASKAQSLRVACAVIMRKRPLLRLLRIDDAEHLDEDSKNLVFDMADEYDWQVIMACVDKSSAIELEFVEPEESEAA